MNLPKEVREILDKFQKAHFQIYIVGGAVRNLLMRNAVSDWDFTTDAKPEEILELFPNGFYDNKFGTVGIPSKSTSEVDEITTMRKEGDYKDHRHPLEVSWTNKIEEDLSRRDFTINAIAMDPKEKIIDPFDGKADIKNHLIKAAGDPNKRFQEDALRLIRAVRIAAELEFGIEKKTFDAICKNARLLEEVSPQRIRDEFFKILESKNLYKGITLLRKSEVLKIILPELDECFGIIQEGPKHDRTYDIGEHSLLSLKHTPSEDPLVRLAALLHDIGKVKTYAKDIRGNVTFYNHDLVGGTEVLKIAKRFNLGKKQTNKLFRLVRFHMFNLNENQTDSAVRRFIKNVGKENIEDMFALRIGDRLGGGTKQAVSWRMEKYKERIKEVSHKPFSVTDLKIDGNDVMRVLKIKPSRKVGKVLETLFQEVLEDASRNNREYLLKKIKAIG